jgi:hypothetical protein
VLVAKCGKNVVGNQFCFFKLLLEVWKSGLRMKRCNFRAPSEEIVPELLADDLRVITVSVPENAMEEVAFLLATAIAERLSAFPERRLPLILPFVNAMSNGRKLWVFIERLLAGRMTVTNDGFLPDCVIDRICASLTIDSE